MTSHRFVWTTHNGELHPERWPRDMEFAQTPVASHDISDEEFKLPIDALAKMYPAPACKA